MWERFSEEDIQRWAFEIANPEWREKHLEKVKKPGGTMERMGSELFHVITNRLKPGIRF
jgi:hypothetical protein